MKKIGGLLQHVEDGVGLVFQDIWEVMVGQGGDRAVDVMDEVAIWEYDV